MQAAHTKKRGNGYRLTTVICKALPAGWCRQSNHSIWQLLLLKNNKDETGLHRRMKDCKFTLKRFSGKSKLQNGHLEFHNWRWSMYSTQHKDTEHIVCSRCSVLSTVDTAFEPTKSTRRDPLFNQTWQTDCNWEGWRYTTHVLLNQNSQ